MKFREWQTLSKEQQKAYFEAYKESGYLLEQVAAT